MSVMAIIGRCDGTDSNAIAFIWKYRYHGPRPTPGTVSRLSDRATKLRRSSDAIGTEKLATCLRIRPLQRSTDVRNVT